MKKIFTVVVAAALILCTFCVTALAADWTEFAVNSSNNSITDAETPVSEDEAELIFKTAVKDSSSWDANSNILVAGDYIYVGNGAEILKLNKDGVEVDSAALMASMSSFAPYIAYANGSIFVYVSDGTNGYIEAVAAATMDRIWMSESIAGMNGFSPITISGNNLYIAVTGYDWGNYSYLPGLFLGMTISDDNTSSQDEVKLNTFAYSGGESYYWNGAAVSGSVAIIGSQDGSLQTINITNGTLIDSFEVGERIASSITYVGGVAYFGTASGLGSITVAADGMIDDASYNLTALGSAVSTTPIVSGGRVYVGTGDFFGGTGLAVIDASTLTKIYSAEVSGTDSYTGNPIAIAGIQGTPVLTTAYTENCIYFSINANPGGITMIKDSSGQTEADITTIFTPASADQNSTASSFATGEDGTLYYTNDSGYLFAVGMADDDADIENPQTGDGSSILMYLLIGSVLAAVLGLALRKLLVKA